MQKIEGVSLNYSKPIPTLNKFLVLLISSEGPRITIILDYEEVRSKKSLINGCWYMMHQVGNYACNFGGLNMVPQKWLFGLFRISVFLGALFRAPMGKKSIFLVYREDIMNIDLQSGFLDS